MKRKLFLILTLTMLTVAFTFPQTVSAASVPYQSTSADLDGVPREKVGDCFIWAKDTTNSQGVRTGSKLLLSKDGKTIKVLKSLKSKFKSIDEKILTNGSTIYYAVNNGNETGTIYKTTYSGKKHTKVKTVKLLASVAACYNGKIYYSRATNSGWYDYNLYSYSIKAKKTKLIKKHFLAENQYGQYLTGGVKRFDVGNSAHYIVNLNTGKGSNLPEAKQAQVDGKKVYCWRYSSYDTMEREIMTCSLTGKNIKTIKKLSSGGYPLYFGRSFARFEDTKEGLIDYIYATNEIIDKKTLLGEWENIDSTCIADTISIELKKDGTVICWQPRSEYHGTYHASGNVITMVFTKGKDYYNAGEVGWHENNNLNLKIKGTIKKNKLHIIYDEGGYEWKATLTKKL